MRDNGNSLTWREVSLWLSLAVVYAAVLCLCYWREHGT